MTFLLLINVTMPTTVGISVGIVTFMSSKISCSAELSMTKFLLPRGLIIHTYAEICRQVPLEGADFPYLSSDSHLLNLCFPKNSKILV